MALTIRLRLEVAADVESAMGWYAERSPGLEASFYAEFLRVVRQAAELPGMYPEVHSSVHRALLKGFPYAVFFAAEPPELLVLGCLHERRSPDRWPRE